MGRTVGYARVSKTDQTTDQQIDRLKAAGCETVFTDDGVSGALASRPRWDECLAYLQPGDTLVAVKLDRFGRSVMHLAALFAELAERKIDVRCLDQPIDTATAVGRLVIQLLSSIAEFERELTRERIKDKLNFNARQGKVARGRRIGRDEDDGGPDRRAFGFEDDNVSVRESEAAIIRECAARLLAGEPQSTITADLNAREVRSMRGAPWGYTSFRQVLLRAKNAGYIVHNGEIVGRLPGLPIIDQDTYDRIVALFAGRRTGRQPSDKYLLTGFLFCQCGAALAGRPVQNSNRRQYWCRVKHPGRPFVGTERIEEWAGDWTIKVLRDPQHADMIKREEGRVASERARIEADITSAEELADAVADRLGRGEMTLRRYEAVVKPLEERLAQLRIELALVEASSVVPTPGTRLLQDADPARWQRLAVTGSYLDGTVAEQRAMIARALAGRRFIVGPGTAAKFDPERVSVA